MYLNCMIDAIILAQTVLQIFCQQDCLGEGGGGGGAAREVRQKREKTLIFHTFSTYQMTEILLKGRKILTHPSIDSKVMLLLWFILIVNVRPLSFVFDLLFNLFRIALWPSVGKELPPWLFTCAVFILVPFKFSCGVKGRIWNSIVSVPDHCLFIYFPKLVHLYLSRDMTKPTKKLGSLPTR